MTFSKLCVTFSNTASEQAMLVLVVMAAITKELEKHVIKKLSNMDRVEFKELHIITV